MKPPMPNHAIALLLMNWCQAVAGLGEAKPGIVGHETNPHFLQTGSSDTSMVFLALELRLQDVTEKLHLGFPYPMLQPVIRQLNPPVETKKEITPSRPITIKWNSALNSVKVPLTVQWEGLQINARKLAHLKVGDLLPVEPDRINHACVQL